MILQPDVSTRLQLDGKLKPHCNFDYTNKSESIYKGFAKMQIKFQQIKIKKKKKIYTSIIDYKRFLLRTSPNLSSFCKRVPYIQCGLLQSPYFCIQIFSGLYYLSFDNVSGRLFQFVFLVITASSNRQLRDTYSQFSDSLSKFWVV